MYVNEMGVGTAKLSGKDSCCLILDATIPNHAITDVSHSVTETVRACPESGTCLSSASDDARRIVRTSRRRGCHRCC